MVLLELKCCNMEENELAGARRLLEAAMSTTLRRAWSSLNGNDSVLPYFLCVTLNEVTREPQITGDGFSSKAKAIR